MISERLKSVILRELKLGDAEIQDDTVASSVPGWDSLSHVRIMSAVEREYSIRIGTLEVIRLKCVGDLQRLVDRKTGA